MQNINDIRCVPIIINVGDYYHRKSAGGEI